MYNYIKLLKSFIIILILINITQPILSKKKDTSFELDVIQLGLNDESREVRSLAIDAIVQLWEQDYISVLRNMLQDNNDFVCIKAAEALYKLGDDYKRKLPTNLVRAATCPHKRIVIV